MITIKELKKHIKKMHKKYRGSNYSFLGLVENDEITDEVKSYFTFYTPSGYCGYDWVKGNEKMQELIKNTIHE